MGDLHLAICYFHFLDKIWLLSLNLFSLENYCLLFVYLQRHRYFGLLPCFLHRLVPFLDIVNS